jgi:dienelactone hydrolase
MNKLFYLTIAVVMTFTACTTNTDKGNLAEVSNNTEFGQAGKVTFMSLDSLKITADYYPNNDAENIIILLHQSGFSRGAYKDIAPLLVDSGFACLAVDLRCGNMANEVLNETANRAMEQGLSQAKTDAKQDIQAAINYISNNSTKNIYLWGSSYSASLALILAKEDDRVKRVIAFSPGEFLGNQETVRSAIPNLEKPVFITGGEAEFDINVKPIVDILPKFNVTICKQKLGNHGTKTLWDKSDNTNKIYEKLFRFLK